MQIVANNTNNTQNGNVLEDGKTVSQMINFVGQASAQMEGMIQRVAVQCVFHSHIHGNVDLAKNLLDTLKKGGKSGVRYTALENYLVFFGAVYKNEKKEWKCDKKRRDVNLFNDALKIKQILETQWFSFKHKDSSEEVVKFSPVSSAIKKFKKAEAEGKKLDVALSDVDKAIAELMALRAAMVDKAKI